VNLTLQFLGAACILLPFALLQASRLSQHAYAYLTLNLVGSALLTAVAVVDGQWGFVILQTVWSLVTAVGIAQRARQRPRSA
jgi:hypothetical protein